MPNYLDLPVGSRNWDQQEIGIYNKLPYFLAKQQVKLMPWFSTWTKLLGKQPWTQKSGTVLKGVRKNKSPILRSQFLPNTLQVAAKRDRVELTESTQSAQLYHHKVESNLITFHEDFQAFLDNAEELNRDITEKMTIIPELFYRTAIFHGSPKVMACGGIGSNTIIDSNHWLAENIALSKSANELNRICSNVTQPLTLTNLHLATQIMMNDLGATPYQGGLLADGSDGSFLAHKYCLICDNELWQNWIYDDYLQSNRELNLDIVTSGFRGSLFGCVTSKIERFGLRIAADGSMPAPESVELTAAAQNAGDVIMNPAYVTAPYGVAFLLGDSGGYKAIKPGPPPAPFSKGGMDMSEFQALDWNGKVRFTRNVLTLNVDESNNPTYDTNKYGEYGQFIAQLTMGIIPERRYHVLPIVYMRTRPGVI